MVDIVNSTAIVAASGIENKHAAVQFGAPSITDSIIQHGSISITNELISHGTINLAADITQFQGVAQTGTISTPSASLPHTISVEAFSNTSSETSFLTGSVGTSGTVESFFDTSPFFFTPSETDPNTLRDTREVEPFMVFGKTTIFSLDNFKNTLGFDKILTVSSNESVSFTHILNFNPSSSGLPFTVSGSDDINQVDLTPPFFAETSPASGTAQVPECTTTLEFHVKDGGSALDPGTIEVTVDGLSVVTAGATVTGVVWPVAVKTTIAPGDIEYVFTRGDCFVPASTVTVSGSFADLADVSNLGTDSYQFTIAGSGGLQATVSGALDADPPVITPTNPASSATDISPDTQILWKTTDNATGVDPSTVKLLLNGATKIENDAATGGSFSRTANDENGFDYTYTPSDPFDFGSTVTGSITAGDNSDNSTSLIYEFTTTSSDTLTIENFFLDVDESVLLTTGTLMSVQVTDFTYGVASGTTTFTLNGSVPDGLVTVYSGVGIERVVFSVLVDPLVDFREDLVVVVHAENNFPGSFPVIKEQQFTIRPGYDVNWPNLGESAAGGPEETFPYLTNIEVLSEVKNFAKNFEQSSAFFDLFTEEQHKRDLGAIVVASVKTADIPAILTSVNPFFEYGKIITLEIEADDLVGNQFRLTHIFTIELE